MPRFQPATLEYLLSGAPWELNHNSPQAAGLVADWLMLASRGQNVLRDLARGYNGTFKGAGEPAWRTDGQLGAALDFDGTDDYVGVPSNAALSPTGGFMFSAWLYPHTSGVTKPNQAIVAKGTADGNRSFLFMIGSGNKMILYITPDGTQANRCYREVTSTLVTQNVWQLWQAWFTTGSAPRLHIALNGVELETTLTATEAASVYASTDVFTLGYKVFTTNYFDGYMADPRFYVPAPPAAVRWQMWDPATRWDLYRPLRQFWAVKAAGWLWARRENTLLRM